MNVELEIVRAICDVIKQGGMYALFGITLYMVLQIIKLAVIWGFAWATIKGIINGILSYLNSKLNLKSQTFQAFSDKASDHLVKALDSLSKENGDILKDIEKQLKDLSEKSRPETKTVS